MLAKVQKAIFIWIDWIIREKKTVIKIIKTQPNQIIAE